MGKTHDIKVPGRYDEIKHVVQFVAQGALAAGLDEDAIFHIELCCDEACTNIIEHAYGQEDVGPINVSYETSGNRFTITIRDNGRSFNPAMIPAPSLPPNPVEADTTPDEYVERLKIGGLGIHFMRKLMDEVHFTFDPIDGNTLVMIKQIPERGES